MKGDRARRALLAGRQCLLALAAVALSAVWWTAVSAHADLIASDPAAGSTVIGSPATIRLSFSQPLESASTIQLFTGQFQAVPGLMTSVAGSELQALVIKPLAPATYTVQWSAATEDGHTTEGSYQFAVAPASPGAAGRLGPVVIVIATLASAGVAVFVWTFNRRRRV